MQKRSFLGMFPLPDKSFPADAETLRAALEESLRKVVTPAGPMVTVEEKSYPELAAIRLSLDGATANDRLPPRPMPPVGITEPALRVEHFEMRGRPVRVQGAAINLNCRAREVEVSRGCNAEGKVVLLLKNAAEGNIEISISVADLEAVVRERAAATTRKQGVVLENVRLQLNARTPHTLSAEVQVRARKLFLNTAVRITASLEIDDQLNAHLSGVHCAGEGTLGTLACGFLEPHLQRLSNRDFSLLTLPLGDVKLRDVRIAVGKELRVSAKLGGSETIGD
jgi:hypothetical protein